MSSFNRQQPTRALLKIDYLTAMDMSIFKTNPFMLAIFFKAMLTPTLVFTYIPMALYIKEVSKTLYLMVMVEKRTKSIK